MSVAPLGYSQLIFIHSSLPTDTEDILFLKKNPGIFRFVTLPVKIPDKMKVRPWNLKLSYKTLIETPRPKTKTHGGNSTWFFLMTPPWKLHPFFADPWNFHSLFFFSTPRNSMSSFSCLDYFWNSPLISNKETS